MGASGPDGVCEFLRHWGGPEATQALFSVEFRKDELKSRMGAVMGVRIQHRAGGFCWNHQIWRGRALSKASKKQKGTRLGTRGSKLCPAGWKNPQIQPGVLCSTQPRSIPHQRQTGGTWGHTDPSPLSPSPGTLHSLEFWEAGGESCLPSSSCAGAREAIPSYFWDGSLC